MKNILVSLLLIIASLLSGCASHGQINLTRRSYKDYGINREDLNKVPSPKITILNEQKSVIFCCKGISDVGCYLPDTQEIIILSGFEKRVLNHEKAHHYIRSFFPETKNMPIIEQERLAQQLAEYL